MIIEIEAYNIKNVFLTGKTCTEKELKQKVSYILSLSNDNFVELFCRQYSFDKVNYKFNEVDFVIDLDTHLVYHPKY